MTRNAGRRPGSSVAIAMGVAVLIVAALVTGVALLVHDVDVQAADGETFCGSAYDVSFLKRDGYLGGEYAADQDAIDADCIRASNPYAFTGLAIVLAALLLPWCALGFLVRRHRVPPA